MSCTNILGQTIHTVISIKIKLIKTKRYYNSNGGMRKNTQPVLRKYVIFSAKITVIIQQEDTVIIQKEDTWTIYKMLLLLDSVRLFPCPPPPF